MFTASSLRVALFVDFQLYAVFWFHEAIQSRDVLNNSNEGKRKEKKSTRGRKQGSTR